MTVICVALSTESTLRPAGIPTDPTPDAATIADPGIILAVLERAVINAEPAVIVAVTLKFADPTAPSSIFLSSTVNVFELTVVVIPLIVKFPPTVKLPGISRPPDVNVNTVVSGLRTAPEAPPGPVLNTICPLRPVPVPWPASIRVSAPIILVPVALPALNVAVPPVPLVAASPPNTEIAPPAPLVLPPTPP